MKIHNFPISKSLIKQIDLLKAQILSQRQNEEELEYQKYLEIKKQMNYTNRSASHSNSPPTKPSFKHFLEKEEQWVNKKNKKRLEMQSKKANIDMPFKPNILLKEVNFQKISEYSSKATDRGKKPVWDRLYDLANQTTERTPKRNAFGHSSSFFETKLRKKKVLLL
jgi:poly-D-alanine transfer protein DltD